MSTTPIDETLVRKAFPFFSDQQLLDEISQQAVLLSFNAGDTVMDYGEYVRLVPLVLKGSLKVMRENEEGQELFLYFLNAGESCSMSFTCCMASKKSSVRAIAEEDTVLLGIPARFVDEWIGKFPAWKQFVLRSYDQRMVELINAIDSIAFKRLDERLMDYLRQKADTRPNHEVQATHQEIALDLNASREAISRLLKQLENMGKVELGRNRIKVL